MNSCEMDRSTPDGSLRYVVDALIRLDKGDDIQVDFTTKHDVGKFCGFLGIQENWAEKTIKDIATARPPLEIADLDASPLIVPEAAATSILNALKKVIDLDVLQSRDPGATFDKTILNDFLPKGERFPRDGNSVGLGHLWEFQYSLQVELEHGRTRGTNVTNNHPLLTGMIVMAHLTEDTLYYARLWKMEVEGELFKAEINANATTALERELVFAQKHLDKRLAEQRVLAGI